MIYLIIAIVLFASMQAYFRIADRHNIIDKPNSRSSHTQITIRGGGIIFYLAACAWFTWSGAAYPYFFLGLTLISAISLLDDIRTLSNRVRASVHLIAVLLMLYQSTYFEKYVLFFIPFIIILIIGTLNAYNFMDGINGITASYSFAVLGLLAITNTQLGFVDPRLLYCTAIGNAVFAFYNFRSTAKCFAGDVGSISMSFILIFSLLLLIGATDNPIYMLFFAVYGVDSVMTIIYRLIKGENIFKAHRSHLYQYMSNEMGANRLVVASSYGVLQFIIGLLTIQMATAAPAQQLLFATGILLVLSCVYMLIRRYILKKHIGPNAGKGF